MAGVLGMFVLLGVPHGIGVTRSDVAIFRAFVYLFFFSWVAVIDMQKDVGAELRVVLPQCFTSKKMLVHQVASK
jgi:hypothetical protein